jgi:hypothetical protein
VGANNGTLLNGASFAAGEVGGAFSFNGASNSYVEVADSPTLRLTNALTIECWAKRLNTSEVHNLVEKGGDWTGGQTDFEIGLNDTYASGSHFGFSFAGGWRGCAVTPDTAWHHYTAVAVSGQADPVLCIDGVAQAITDGGGPATIRLNASTRPLHIGAQLDAQTGWFYYSSTMIDEVAIYSLALSAAEVAAIYDAGSAGKCRSPHAATATATVVNDFVVGATINDGGWGYTNTPAVRIIGGGGSGAQAVAVVSNGVVIAVNVLDAGSGYTNAPVIVIAPPFIPLPTMGIAAMSFLSFTELAVGTNYQVQVYLDSTWSNVGAAFTAASSNFSQYVSGTVGPSSYRLATTSVPAQANAAAQVVNGFVVGATVTGGGSGYGSNVVVSIVGGGGNGATASATVSGGVVTKVSITAAGIGYTNPPSIIIAPPLVNALWPMVNQAIGLALGNLLPYDNYQLEFTPVVGVAWSNLGSTFTPTSSTTTQNINVSGNAGFFRVKYLP